MKFPMHMLLTLLMLSGPVSATLLSYNVSGNLNQGTCADLNFDPKCGEFNAMFTIDDAQTPSGTPPFFTYGIDEGMAILADGTVIDNSLFLSVRSESGTSQGVSLDFFTTGGAIILTMIWIFPDNTFDHTNIGEILNALENGPLTDNFSEVESFIAGNCNDDNFGDCIGTVGLIEQKAVPEPHILALLSIGLAGLVFIRRRINN